MKLSMKQIRMLHVIPRRLGLDDAARRMIQANVGGCASAADPAWTREGFIAVVAHYERAAGGQLAGFSAAYWADQDGTAGPGDSLRWRIRREAREIGLTDSQLESFLAGPHMTCGDHRRLDDAPAYWLARLLEGLKAMKRRHWTPGRQRAAGG